MRFASIGGQSNYAQAGKAVANDAAKTFDVARKNSVDFGGLAQAAMKTRSDEKVAAMRAGAAVTKTAIDAKAYGKVKDAKRSIAKDGVMRKAGGLIALGVGGLAEKSEKRDNSLMQSRIDRDRATATKLRTEAEGMTLPEQPKVSTPTNTGGTGATNKSTTSSSGSTSISPIANGSYTGSLDSLSAEDKKWISYAVSSEAALGTDDEFGVAGVLINRMKSGNYPTTAYDVAHQKGQFEGVEIGNSVHDQKLHDRLFSSEGLTKLEGALTTLDGRDSFKGQALLQNRSSKGNKDGKLDPMFHSSGNYFHHSYQT
jgi:hypothetical protein